MVSFAHPAQMDIVAESAQSFVLDNGAFSAWKSGKPLDIDGYASWVKEWKTHPGFDWHLVPDVIDGDEKANDELLYGWITRSEVNDAEPVPVWHLHESIHRLQRLSGHSRRVALGSSGEFANPGSESWWARMREAMTSISIDGRPCCKLHGLRMLNVNIFQRLPFASADSTNAPQNAGASKRFGMYSPAMAFQRANVIADRIESFNSAERFVVEKQGSQLMLF